MNNFEIRLLALEKTNARYRIAFLFILALLVYFIISSFSAKQVPDLIQAKKFELVNDNGQVLVRLDNLGGYGAVTTYTYEGKILTDILPTETNAGGIVIYDGKGKQNTVFTDVTGGGGSLKILNKDQQPVVFLGRNTMNGGSLTIKNTNSVSTVLITSDTEGNGVMLTYNNLGTQSSRIPQ